MKAEIKQGPFGKLPGGEPVDLFTLTNRNGLVVKVTNYGVILTEIHAPDRQRDFADVVLGFDNLQPYLNRHPYFGALVGRYANRIARGRFTLEGKTYQLAINNGPNHLHGGLKGFDKAVWKALPKGDHAILFTHTSPDGDENYPGNLSLKVMVGLSDENELSLDYTATTDKPTPINLTNHSYFNLAGRGNILDHELWIDADNYTPVDAYLIPTGEVAPVKGTPLDFTKPTAIGSRFNQIQANPVGYDNNFVLNHGGKSLALIARVRDPKSGRVLETFTTQPGVQLYTSNFLDGSLIGKGGIVYGQHCAFCLETQHYPDAVNHPNFPSAILRPGEVYQQNTVYKFSAQ